MDLEECPDETCALARESELLRTLRPRFNRAGTWTGPPRFLAWRKTEQGLDLAVLPALEDGWLCHGPFGAGAALPEPLLPGSCGVPCIPNAAWRGSRPAGSMAGAIRPQPYPVTKQPRKFSRRHRHG